MDALISNVDVLHPTAPALGRRAASRHQLEQTAKDFEAVFMAQMLKPMWEGIETNPMFGGGAGEDVMKDMLVQEYGKAMVRNDEFGLSPAILSEMIRIQEEAGSASRTGG